MDTLVIIACMVAELLFTVWFPIIAYCVGYKNGVRERLSKELRDERK